MTFLDRMRLVKLLPPEAAKRVGMALILNAFLERAECEERRTVEEWIAFLGENRNARGGFDA